LFKAFSLSAFLVLVFWYIDTLFLQIQMAVFGSTPLPNLVVKALFSLLVLLVALWGLLGSERTGIPRSLLLFWRFFVLYLVVELFVLRARFGYDYEYLIFSYNAYYFPIILLPAFFYFRRSIRESSIVKILWVLFVPVALLGIAQHFLNSTVLPTDSANGYLGVVSWDFFGTVRAFSLFAAPSYFGHFIAFVAAIALALAMARRVGKVKIGLLLVLALISAYATWTRASELEVLCVILAVWLLHSARTARKLLLLPIAYGAFGILVAFLGPMWLEGMSGQNLLSNSSIFERYSEWLTYSGTWLHQGLWTFLLGTGVVQNDRFQTTAGTLIDNSFIGVGVHIGFLGLLLWVAITYCVWKYMLSGLDLRRSPVRVASAAAWSVWIFTSIFNTTLFFVLPFFAFVATEYGMVGSPSYIRAEGPQPAPGFQSA
jgi:hypothetical protein